jgi:general secretion pathway protein G
VYTALEGLTQSQINARSRFNKMERPLNHDFDLYSKGKDGRSVPRIDKPHSYDDIIRASSGAYVGPASEY